MTSGFKDNAANYAINTNLSTKISANQVAEDNAIMGLDMVQTANYQIEKFRKCMFKMVLVEKVL